MKVLVVVDMQNDFIDAALGTKEAEAIVPSVIEKIKKYEAYGGLIIYTKDTHFDDYLSTREGRHLPVCHCIKGTPGHDIPDEILRGHDIIFEKLTFGSVELVDYLKGVDFDEVELIGLCTDICVVSNALLIKATFPEKEVSVDSACCAGVTPDTHNAALTTMRMCQINVV
ncbi:MAG: cysteine hydrolase [Clostridia bacterium]|nr:cysteine hydrolase [Clostridia bacterium]